MSKQTKRTTWQDIAALPEAQPDPNAHLKRGATSGPLGNAVVPGTAKYEQIQSGEFRHNMGQGTMRNPYAPTKTHRAQNAAKQWDARTASAKQPCILKQLFNAIFGGCG